MRLITDQPVTLAGVPLHMTPQLTQAHLLSIKPGEAFTWSGRAWMRIHHSERIAPTVEVPVSTGTEHRVAPLGHTEDWVWCVSLETGVAQRVSPDVVVIVNREVEVRGVQLG